MKIILLENVKGLGQIGDIKTIADGYGRNFLLPRNIAKLATASATREIDDLKKKLALVIEDDTKNATRAIERHKDTILEFTKKATKTGKMYASVTNKEIADKLSKIVGFNIDPDKVNLDKSEDHIKEVGEYLVEIQLTSEIKMPVKVIVTGE
jgi:large subunit ribosomal protein L9